MNLNAWYNFTADIQNAIPNPIIRLRSDPFDGGLEIRIDWMQDGNARGFKRYISRQECVYLRDAAQQELLNHIIECIKRAAADVPNSV